MPQSAPLVTSQASSYNSNPSAAIGEVASVVLRNNPSVVLLYCSVKYNLEELGSLIKSTFKDQTVIGCTSSGHINHEGFSDTLISAIGISGDINATSYLIDLAQTDKQIEEMAQNINKRFTQTGISPAFGILNIDGLSVSEENVAAQIYKAIPPFVFVGGSAGDDMQFQKTFVYFDGKFLSRHAVFSTFETKLPFCTIKFEHYIPCSDPIVVTDADPNKRIIKELNGERAADVYARYVGRQTHEITPEVCIENPLLFNLGNQNFIRDIHEVLPDGSISLFCAIETGIVLTLGKPNNIEQTATASFKNTQERIGQPDLIIGFDCLHRKLGIKLHNALESMSNIYRQNNVFGFSTYGEQYNGIHINQTFTGIAIGHPDDE